MKFSTWSITCGTSICNAMCPFCVSHMTPKNGMASTEPTVNWRNFTKAAHLAKQSGVTTVMLTGKGEPTLYPGQITQFLKALQPFNFPLIEIQSNGLCAGRSEIDAYLRQWYDLGLTTMAISVVHHTAEKNAPIYTPKSTYIDLPQLIAKLHGFGISVRLAAVLIRMGIDSPEEVASMVDFALQHKVEQLTLRPVNRTERNSASNAKDDAIYKWTETRCLTKEQVQRIKEFLDTNAKPLMNLVHGATVYDFRGQNVCLANSLTLDPDKEEQRQLIFFPDGSLRYDWQFAGARIL